MVEDKDFKLPNIEKEFDLDKWKMPNMAKKLGLDKPKMSNMYKDLGLDKWDKLSRDLNQLATLPNMKKTFGLGEAFASFARVDDSISYLSKIWLADGTIKNAEAVKAALSPGVFGTFKSFDFIAQIKAMDSLISFREMSRKLDYLKISTIPHMSLYRGILDSIDEDTYNQIKEEKEEIREDDLIEEDFTIVRPGCLKVALNINMYVTVTESHIHSNTDVSEEEKKAWEKYIKPVLVWIILTFLSWAFGAVMDSVIENIEIAKTFERIVEIVDDYHYPIETTDVEITDIDIEK